MKIFKLSAAVGIFAFCVSFASVRAQDNPAQAAAREALMKQMSQGQAPAAQTPPTAPAAPAAPAAPVAPAVVVTPTPAAEPASADTFAPTSAQDNPAQAAAREALMKQKNQGQVPAAPVAPAVVVTPTPAAEPASADTNAEAQAAARAAVLQIMHAQNPQQPVTAPSRTSMAASPAMASPVPIVAPPIPISATKEERLQALLALYKADQVTPEEYQKRRAAILADP